MRRNVVTGSLGCAVLKPGRLGRRGQISAVFERSAHLLTEDGVYLTLGNPELPAHPYNILWSGFPPFLSPGQKLTVTAKGLFAEGRQLVGFRDFAEFEPMTQSRPMARTVRRRLALAATLEAVSSLPPRGGFHAMLSRCGENAEDESPGQLAGCLPGYLDRREWAQGARLAAALAHCDWDSFTMAGLELAGMGEGLTPAGDDFLAGVLAALRFHGLSRRRAVLPGLFGEGLAAHAGMRTTQFSAFLLSCSAVGQIAQPLSDWLDAIHRGDAEGAAGQVEAIAGLGHTSGLDTLSGMILALQNVPGDKPWTEQ